MAELYQDTLKTAEDIRADCSIIGILPDELHLDHSREWNEQELIELSDKAVAVLEFEDGEIISLIPLTNSLTRKTLMNRGIQYSLPLSE